MAFNKPSDRRIFLTADKIDYFKIFSFSQRKDGDIYCHWPNFSKTKWVSLTNQDNQILIDVFKTPENAEKLSIHKSGVAKYRQNDPNFDPTRIFGGHLLNVKKNEVGFRHLFTSFISEPKDVSINAPYGNRKSDIPIFAHKLKPFVIAFFAVPQQLVPVKIQFSPIIHKDYFEKDAKIIENIGVDLFSLGYHDIVWFAYSTKEMTNWPKGNLVFYYNGFSVPLFFGYEIDENNENAKVKFALQEPTYKFENNELLIRFEFPDPKDF